MNNTLTEIDEVSEKVSYFIKEFATSLEEYEEGDVESTFEKLNAFAAKKRELSKCLHYFKTLKFIESTRSVLHCFFFLIPMDPFGD